MAVAEPSRFNRLVVAGVEANLFRTDSSGLIVKALRSEGDPANPVARTSPPWPPTRSPTPRR